MRKLIDYLSITLLILSLIWVIIAGVQYFIASWDHALGMGEKFRIMGWSTTAFVVSFIMFKLRYSRN